MGVTINFKKYFQKLCTSILTEGIILKKCFDHKGGMGIYENIIQRLIIMQINKYSLLSR